jgi:hypothetical protein
MQLIAPPGSKDHIARNYLCNQMEREMITHLWANRLAGISALSAVIASAQAGGATPLADSVRAALDRFKDASVATEEAYAPGPCVNGQMGGAMGIHYVNSDYLKDDAIDLAHPEALIYEPTADGKLALVGVEYITFKGPAVLEGQLFSFNGAPNRYGLDPFYELHVWAWKANPTGTFADWNPDVSCDAATAEQTAGDH